MGGLQSCLSRLRPSIRASHSRYVSLDLSASKTELVRFRRMNCSFFDQGIESAFGPSSFVGMTIMQHRNMMFQNNLGPYFPVRTSYQPVLLL